MSDECPCEQCQCGKRKESTQYVICQSCDGLGWYRHTHDICRYCGGTGRQERSPDAYGSGIVSDYWNDTCR